MQVLKLNCYKLKKKLYKNIRYTSLLGYQDVKTELCFKWNIYFVEILNIASY